MKSTNSAFSDYNFLFENIDQTLQTNTQLMMEELLLQANHQPTLPPLVLEAARIQGTQVSETTIARNATIRMNDVDGARQQDTAGSYIPVTLGEEYNNSPYQNDITQEEIISIEDTYRETAAAGLIGSYNEYRESKNNEHDSGSQPYGTKSMTIIHEDDGEYEESQFLMSNNPKNSLLRSKADLLSKSNC